MPPRNQKNSFRYIAFEGIDGCGKSTQAKLFTDYLENKGFCVFLTKEPGGSTDKIRDLLLNYRWSKRAELFLFLADRAENAREIKSKLEKGCIVVSDRCMYSTIAYQGFGEGLDIDFLEKLNLFSTDGLKPDIVFCFDVDLETMNERVGKRDVIESKPRDFFYRVREGYRELAKRNDRFFLIDGKRKKEEVFGEVLRIWESL